MPKCTKCQIDKPATDFSFDGFYKATGERKLRSKCRLCMRELCKQWRATHKEYYLHYNKVTRKERLAAKNTALPVPASVAAYQEAAILGTEAEPVIYAAPSTTVTPNLGAEPDRCPVG